MSPETMRLVLSAIAVLGGLGSIIIAIIGYRQRTRQEKARWLETMVLRFSQEVVPPVRIAVGQVGDPAMKRAVEKRLTRQIEALTAREAGLLEDFDRYFTFFEFLHYLHETKVLNAADINKPFHYFLTCLEANDATRDWLHTFYPNLRRLVSQAQRWTIKAEVALLERGEFDASVLRERLAERIGRHPEAAALIEKAIAKALR